MDGGGEGNTVVDGGGGDGNTVVKLGVDVKSMTTDNEDATTEIVDTGGGGGGGMLLVNGGMVHGLPEYPGRQMQVKACCPV